MIVRPALALGIVLLLAACNKSPDTNRSASGEVLQGTISDDMLPLDKVTSQPPLAAPTAGKGGGKPGEATAADTAAADSSADGDAAAAPDAADAPTAASGQ